jgi:hypothetical protein
LGLAIRIVDCAIDGCRLGIADWERQCHRQSAMPSTISNAIDNQQCHRQSAMQSTIGNVIGNRQSAMHSAIGNHNRQWAIVNP